MPDIVDAATRSRMMTGIKATNTRPELAIRKALHRKGFRYRLHD
ncbi:MAG: very short patch repair endonuclease, partial [Fimbriimonadaceae bacterium]